MIIFNQDFLLHQKQQQQLNQKQQLSQIKLSLNTLKQQQKMQQKQKHQLLNQNQLKNQQQLNQKLLKKQLHQNQLKNLRECCKETKNIFLFVKNQLFFFRSFFRKHLM